MIFLIVAGVGLFLCAVMGALIFTYSFWFEVSDGEWWGFIAALASCSVVAAITWQIALWVLP